MSESNLIEVTKFQPLFGKSKDGKCKNWEIRVEKYKDYSEIVTLYGYVNKIETRVRVSKGKNIGKSNETTHYQQAISDATSKWNKKKDIEKYVLKMEDLKSENNEKVEGESKETKQSVNDEPVLPMLAQEFQKQKKKVKYPCYMQPKLDGYRMIYDSTNKRMTTRQGKDFTIVKESGLLLEELYQIPKGWILDGELYVHTDLSFEDLGVLRKTKGLTFEEKEKLGKVEYFVYDCIRGDNINDSTSFEKRWQQLQWLKNKFQKIKLVDTFTVENENEILKTHQLCVQDGFEGSMIRNKEGRYLEKNRSYDLLKYKDFKDAEFEIVNYTNEVDTSGDDKNLVVWIVKIKPDLLCKVRPKGNKEQRQQIYQECETKFDKYRGRKLWVKFFDYTSDGNLRFPTTKTNDVESYIRDEIV
jgi:hypothetical protein